MQNKVVTLPIDDLPLDCQRLSRGTYPKPAKFSAIGNTDILHNKKLALFCSVKCPGNVIIQTYDCMKALREAGITVIGGFHSPMEKECLNILLLGSEPVVICPARSLQNMRIKPEFKKPLEEGRLLFLSPFLETENRISTQRADLRNLFVAAIAEAVLIAHAEPGSKTEELFHKILEMNKTVFTINSDSNSALMASGAVPVSNIVEQFDSVTSRLPVETGK
jgi:predicted Rossmann fold nucleotide-binding protein DprA/Smf involved in DNA uptake